MDNKTLPILIQQDFTTPFTYSLPLCILLSDDTWLGWYYENYIKIFTQFVNNDFFECKILDALDYSMNGVIETGLIRYSYFPKSVMRYIKDINVILKDNIQNNNYCILFLDEYYLLSLKRIVSKHTVHEIMVYGYDDLKEIYQCIAFYDEKFQNIEIPYNEIQKAYTSVFKYIDNYYGWNDRMFLTFRRVLNKEIYPFSFQIFLNNLKQYYNGTYSQKEEYLFLFNMRKNNYPGHNIHCGINVIQDYIEYFNSIYKCILLSTESKNINDLFKQYKALHMLIEHKRGLLKRLTYVATLYCDTKQSKELIEKYKTVVDLCETTRMLSIKASRILNIQYKEKLLNITNRIIKLLTTVSIMEKTTICSFIELFNQVI